MRVFVLPLGEVAVSSIAHNSGFKMALVAGGPSL